MALARESASDFVHQSRSAPRCEGAEDCAGLADDIALDAPDRLELALTIRYRALAGALPARQTGRVVGGLAHDRPLPRQRVRLLERELDGASAWSAHPLEVGKDDRQLGGACQLAPAVRIAPKATVTVG